MNPAPSIGPRGKRHFDVLAFCCDGDGLVQEIVADDLELDTPLRAGQSMLDIVEPHSREKARQFLATVLSRQAASGWELNVGRDGRAVSVVCSGAMQQDRLFVVIGRTARDITNVVETLEQINNEQLNAFRMAFRDQMQSFERRARTETSAYEELSRLNNELANAQRELTQKSSELARLNEEKNRFLGMAAHDLRNPLSVILGYAGFLIQVEGDGDPDKQRIYEEIASSSRFMLDLINDLLDVSQIEAGRRELRISTFDPITLVRRVTEAYQSPAQAKGIRLDVHTSGPAEGTITGDEAKLRRVIGNLIGNAVKYSRSGTVVEVSAESDESQVIIIVRDQGIGIPADQLEAIFLPFVHLDNAGTAGERSTGLGLSIVAQLVDLLGGTIRVESEVGKGSAFRLSIPRVMTSGFR